MSRFFPLLLCAFAVVVGVGGCSHYQLGTGTAPAFRTLHVEPVANRTLLPQSQAVVATHLREAFARDARVQLANSSAGAEATLSLTLVGYRREIAAVREGDTGLARKFNITLEALCTLRATQGGKIIFENRPVSATREAFTDGGQLQAEYQVLPLLAQALADKVVHTSLDIW
ncbi:MAG: LPS assembly lipoprotein LptE [Opitutaceae bacterium]|nr:LPS assembly lipoprotein LptE [Opitutaceae bacterium]